MLDYLSDIRKNPHRLMFEPGFLGFLVNPFYTIRAALFRSVAKLSPSVGGRILDVGCGAKPYALLFAHAEEYIGIDIETSGHDHGRSKVDIFYDGKSIPFEDGSVDTVVSFEVFEHVFDLDGLLHEIRRVLRPDGKLVFTMPFAWPEHEEPYDFGRYTSFGIADKLSKCGYEVESMAKTGHFVSALSQLFVGYVHGVLQFRNPVLRLIFQLLFVVPFSILAGIVGFILPKRYNYFCNLVILARKTAALPENAQPGPAITPRVPVRRHEPGPGISNI